MENKEYKIDYDNEVDVYFIFRINDNKMISTFDDKESALEYIEFKNMKKISKLVKGDLIAEIQQFIDWANKREETKSIIPQFQDALEIIKSLRSEE